MLSVFFYLMDWFKLANGPFEQSNTHHALYTQFLSRSARKESNIPKLTKIEFTIHYTRQIILIFTNISIKIHRIVCIKQA